MTSPLLCCVFASGSKGNCTMIRFGSTTVLVDCGIPYRRLGKELSEFGLKPSDIDHVLITHEHSDHVNGLPSLLKRHSVPLHMNSATYLRTAHLIPDASVANLFDSTFEIGDIRISPFGVSHDAADPVGFTVTAKGVHICIATDMGWVTEDARNAMRKADVLILETNHDERMLMLGNYPPMLKTRIAGRHGHLSNRQAGECLADVVSPNHRHVVLAHLSEENNRPDLALRSVEQHLWGRSTPLLHVASQYSRSAVLEM